MSGAPVVLCVDRESYVSALVAMEKCAMLFGDCRTSERLLAAVKDFERAHAIYMAIDARITTPALLKRQAG